MGNTTSIICNNIGCSGTTPCHVQQLKDGTFEARMGIAILGNTNMDEEGFKRCDYNPFSDDFHDNYSCGIGITQNEAIEKMKEDMSDIASSFWY